MSLLSPEIESTYEIVELMGEGGMGAVYKARHRVFNELCVIKVMKARLQDNPQLRKRFENEARKGKQIEHPNIARVQNFFVGSNGNAHLVMEFLEGVNLRQFHERRGKLDPATAITVATQGLAALACLHEHNLVHRDVSPENLMMIQGPTGAWRVKLIDLGIAKSLDDDSMTRVGSFMGKAAYAAPEQFGGAVDARSDLYSFGIVLYELLTGVQPIEGTTVGSYAAAHHAAAPVPFAVSDPDGRVPERLRNVIMKALEKQPGRRFQSAAEFSAALGGQTGVSTKTITSPTAPIQAEEAPTPVPPPVEPERPAALRTRRRLWPYVAAAAILLSLAGLVTGLRRGDPLTLERKNEIKNIIRKVVDEGGQPSMNNPLIAGFLAKTELTAENVEPFAVEYAAKLRDAAKEIDRGKEAIARGDPQGAYYAFAEATRIDPDSSYAWSNFGGAAMLLNKQAEATDAYQRALVIDPSNWLAHYNLGCQYARAGRLDDALDKVALAVAEMRRKHTPAEIKSNLDAIRNDEALRELWNDPRFKKIVSAR